jgi:hypothetical protein
VRAATPGAFVPLWCLVALAGVVAPAGSRARAAQPTAAGSAVPRDTLSRADAARLREKVAAIEQEAARPPAPGAARPWSGRKTILNEREVNAFLAFDPDAQIPVGIAQARIAIMGDRRLSASAVVDLDVVRAHHKSTGWFDPVTYLSGRLPVALSGRLRTGNGLGRFELDSASISSVPIPKTLLQELVTYYSRTASNPGGLNLDDEFLLPARIQQIEVRRGEAVVIQ